ncbi:MAG: hypothetical protein OEZ06_26825 [Myxococcales bacterium]|nr:hypothetical protein [Myxococcales bacterium]
MDRISTVDASEVADGFLLEAGNDRMSVRVLAPGVVRASVRGNAAADFFEPTAALLDHYLAEGLSVAICVDTERMNSYDTLFRERWSHWLQHNRENISGMPFLVRSGIVRLGINMVNSLTGGLITTHADRTSFEAAVAAEVSRERDRLQATAV